MAPAISSVVSSGGQMAKDLPLLSVSGSRSGLETGLAPSAERLMVPSGRCRWMDVLQAGRPSQPVLGRQLRVRTQESAHLRRGLTD